MEKRIRLRKLSAEDILAIRGEVGRIRVIADKFGISEGYVSRIKSFKAKEQIKGAES